MKRKALCTFMLVINFSSIAAEYRVHWGYSGQEGPAYWGKLSPDFSLCDTGKNQSPINIQGALETHLGTLNIAFQPGKQEIVNNGNTVQINVSDGDSLQLDNETFMLEQFHFHAPSENLINSKAFPLEAHFVYKAKEGALTVLALMFKEGKANPQLAQAWQQMPTKIDQATKLSKPLQINKLLPKNQGFYRFSGSLTTPPCSEGVRWLVLKEEVTASTEQIRQFRAAIQHANNRPVQPLNGRVIVE